jgi:hypothetical protein
MSSPYWIRLRGTGDDDEKDKGRRFGGHDKEKGVETLTASWDGAVVVSMRMQDGVTWCTVSIIPWGQKGGIKKGMTCVIYDGPIDGRVAQQTLID